MSARLYIPRVLPMVVGVLGLWLTWGASSSISPRLERMASAPPAARPMLVAGLVLAGAAVLLGLSLVRTAVRWATCAVTIDDEGLRARLWWRQVVLPIKEVKGVVLRQDGGIPQLRIVPRDGDVLVLPGWSLRGRWTDDDDDPVEDAGPVLEALGAHHGFGVKVLTLLGPVPDPPPRPPGAHGRSR